MQSTRVSTKLTQYIRYQQSTHSTTHGVNLWKSNPSDPYIYISFFWNDLIKIHGNDEFVRASIVYKGMDNLQEKIISQIKSLIQTQWVQKANLPIRFLDNTANLSTVKKKNICFILKATEKRTVTSEAGSAEVGGATYYLRSENSLQDIIQDRRSPSDYHLILLANRNSATLTNQDTYNILHELGHGLAEFKHPVAYQPKLDVKPFKALDCALTVMVYQQNCAQVLKKEWEVFGAQQVSIYDPNPVIQQKLKLVYNAFPNQLGSVDLEAAKEFVESWRARNAKNISKKTKPAANKIEKNLKTPNTFDHDLMISPMELGLNVTKTYDESFFHKIYQQLSEQPEDLSSRQVWHIKSPKSFFGNSNNFYQSQSPRTMMMNETTLLPTSQKFLLK